MVDLMTLVRNMREDGDFETMTRNPMNQFGEMDQNRFYLGAAILPEMMKPTNKYREEDIVFRPLIADDSTRYGTPQLKGRDELIYMDVEFSNIDAKRAITSQQLDTINNLLQMENVDAAANMILSMIRMHGERALRDKKELKRWQTIINGKGKYMTSGNIETDQADYSPPATHRFPAGVDITDDAIDPMEEVIVKARKILRASGYELQDIICRDSVALDMEGNEQVKERDSNLRVTTSLDLAYNRLLDTEGTVNRVLGRSGYTTITTYDLDYWDQTGQKFFIPDDVMIFIGRTPRVFPITNPNSGRLLTFNSLGYYGIGTCQNQTSPGDVIKVNLYDQGKPDYLETIADSTGLPVIQEIEAIVVVSNLYNV